MQGMILAAGYGTRLRPLTDDKPKALVPVNGRPMLEHIIEKFIFYGVTDIFINAHYFAGQIEKFIDITAFEANITVIKEDRIRGTGGGIFNMLQYISDDDFIVYNTDVICDVDLERLMNFHKQNQAAATMVMQNRDTYNQVVIDSENNFCGLNLIRKNVRNTVRQPSGGTSLLAFCGIHAVNKQKIESYGQNLTEYSIIDVYLKAASGGEIIKAYRPDIIWFDAGTPEKLKKAEEYLKKS
ncbi:MAG: sugar phosphate nucleotidyltransferase [Candidatus Delongbacteria bacterium]